MPVLAALIMFAGVALGAFGAHALRPTLETLHHLDVWQTAVNYHLTHGLAVLVASVWRAADPRAAASRGIAAASGLWVAGIALFSGSLYALSLGGPKWLGPVTPLGGACFLAGWLVFAVAAVRITRSSRAA